MAEPPDLDRTAVRRQFDRRVAPEDPGAFLLREVAGRMFERLDLIRLAPERILDVGCGLGDGVRRLRARWPQALLVGLDLSPARIARAAAADRPGPGAWAQSLARRLTGRGGETPAQYLVGDAHRLPLVSNGFDLVWSNLAFHWFDDPPAAIGEWYRVVRPNGLLMFSSLGVDTLRELRAIGWPLPALPDMHDIGDALVRAGFAEPVMDTERLTVTWQDAGRLLADLRGLGGDARPGRPRGLATPRQRDRLLAGLARGLGGRGPDAPLAVSIEVVHGHAWCGPAKRLPEGYAPIEFRPASRPRGGG